MAKNSIHITTESIRSTDAKILLSALSAELEHITGNSGDASFDDSDMDQPRSCFAIARDAGGNLLGCSAIRPYSEQTAEMKRVFSVQSGRGVGRAMIQFLEKQAISFGFERMILETRKINQQAVSFYLANGYKIIPNYGKYAGRIEAVCFEKALITASKSKLKEI